ncbi:exonuclease domain-containing protein [Sulfitobacter sp. D35]|uniref:3'-5' exonuclease n=1 Tax=Sulfitobacter sp. D35 TaxID=3083252 RepID=UPI00296F0685|nr:exonuclease domain-containing protein [Sulfitobacter sp. D35]MDW4498818.1 exonuclease domain-containing protein [Sulfitobacter sp. D35]
MAEALGLRLRFALFFAALAGVGMVCLALGLWLGHRHAGGPVTGYLTAGIVGGFGLAGACALVGLLFDENVARPILSVAADLETRARSGVATEIDAGQARYLGALAPSAQAIHAALEEARASQERAIAERTARVARDRALFETLVGDLAEGVVVLSPDQRIMLYNRTAVAVLGDLALGRSLERYIRPGPVESAIARLAETGSGPESFLATTADGVRVVTGAVSEVSTGDEAVGNVLLFRDTTEDLRIHGELERLLRTTIEGGRRPAAAMGAVLDVLQSVPDLDAAKRARFDAALRDEIDNLWRVLAEAAEAEQVFNAARWPIREVAVRDLFAALDARFAGQVSSQDSDLILRCDGYAITEVLAQVVSGVLVSGSARVNLCAEAAPDGVRVLTRAGQGHVAQGDLETWLSAPFSPAYGAYSGHDALRVHRTDMWVEAADAGMAVVLILPEATRTTTAHLNRLRHSYDFELPAEADGVWAQRRLSDLTFVVFDTETTGLDPDRDAVIQLAGVRIVGRKLVPGEIFDALVDPGRPIPESSSAIHGLTDDMVAGARRFETVAAQFQGFADGAVLVAHHAAFDMSFLDRRDAASELGFDQPVLCTARLSLSLFPHSSDHTLDALAARLGVSIAEEDRHTAIGDARATAEVFLKLVALMQARGIDDLGTAMAFQARA